MKAASDNSNSPRSETPQANLSGLGNPFKLIFEQSQQMQCIINLNGKIVAANKQTRKLAPPAATSKLLGQRIWNAPWWRPEQAIQVKQLFKTALQGNCAKAKLELGSTSSLNLRYSFSFSPVVNTLGQTSAILLEGHLIKALAHNKEQSLDHLTGLATQDLLNTYLKGITKRSQNNPGHLFAVLSLKLEGLQNIRNLYGETLENELIVSIARKFRANTRDGDLVARVKEDSFVVVLDRLQVTRNALDFAQRCLTFLRSQCTIKGNELKIQASIGVAFGDSSSSAQVFLNQANESLDKAEQSGLELVVFGVSQFDQGAI